MKNFLCDVFFSAESAKNFAKAAELFGCYYGMMEQMMNFLCVNFSLCLLFSAVFLTQRALRLSRRSQSSSEVIKE